MPTVEELEADQQRSKSEGSVISELSINWKPTLSLGSEGGDLLKGPQWSEPPDAERYAKNSG